ncbi:helix-turn-helix domain-containing protein [Paenirhodobacter sp.]|uniref:helix-turn-helix domain-containing protein n=1 Tax=Paenirhodobacter sp. TaxID=1965326 RepID=UPI003B3D31FA
MPERYSGLSLVSRQGLQLLATEIRARRKQLHWSEQDLADRLGCARKTVRAIEEGKASVAIGYVLEAAYLVGIDLFGGSTAIADRLATARSRLDLLPQRIHSQRPEVKDDF